MKLYTEGKNYKLYEGNMLDMLDVIEPNSIDSVVTDPPYELGFMGKGWDSSGVAFQKETWEKCLSVLKPGGYLLAFGGTRTYHRIACAIEDAGFEIRDTIMWVYGSGFPKSMNIGLAIDKKNGVESEVISQSDFPDIRGNNYENNDGSRIIVERKKACNEWDGWGTALKPAYEPIIVARKPCEGSCVDNVMKYGVGGINVDECRIPFVSDEDYKITADKNQHEKFGTKPMTNNTVYGDYSMVQPKNYQSDGRYPANVILTYSDEDYDEVCGGMPYTVSSGGSGEASKINTFANTYNGGWGKEQDCAHLGGLGDSGSASRYFYCAKASARDREDGCDALDDKYFAQSNQSKAELKRGNLDFTGDKTSPLNAFNTVHKVKNNHPTVKPTDLMQYLVRLVTPKNGTILDPFNGSGSTGKAAMWENKDREAGYNYIGIELTPEYLPISQARIEYVVNIPVQYKFF